ncbi:MAG: biotin--[acetyl-CoA-carboxylase] ligase [Flavobacteriaceae bacterium]|nr:biotin--[acetyl-CoA-carboxylase] ligase [Flavobacteriaceae bacterium]
MNIHKFGAIPSTNSYLKELVKKGATESFTIVSAEYQTKGRGQMETTWYSSEGNNLLFSILINFEGVLAEDQFYLNCAVSLGILEALRAYNIPELTVKWPNDIMSENRKLAGILIENSLSQGQIKYAVVGIGLNVNEEKFPLELPKAVSMYQILGRKTDRNELLLELAEKIRKYAGLFITGQYHWLIEKYQENLYKFGQTHKFETSTGDVFSGKIRDVKPGGNLVIEFEDGTQTSFRFKEIRFL